MHARDLSCSRDHRSTPDSRAFSWSDSQTCHRTESTLAHEAPFLTIQFFRLNRPVDRPYAGSRQGQTGLAPRDIEEVSAPESPTLGGMVKSLATLATDVSALQTSVRWLTWAIQVIVVFGMTVIGIIVAIK
jgi:hypothetical protein